MTFLKTLIFLGILFCFFSCKKDKANIEGGFPQDIGEIMITKCATTGCHNDVSKEAAAGLSLESWDKLFEGSRNNAAVVPYRSDQSFLMFFVNTFEGLGPAINPVMPFNDTPLSRQEVVLIRDWIDIGAPNHKGEVKFPDDPSRKKMYVINQGCDNVAVLDYETQLVMRYFDVGASDAIESPHKTKIKDGFYYVCFFASNVFQKYNTSNDNLVGEADIGFGSWNTFVITDDSKTAFVVDWDESGSIAVVDLESMTMIKRYKGLNLLEWPHGSALKDNNTLYVTAQFGNFIYKIDVTSLEFPEFEIIIMAPGETKTGTSKYDPHDIHFNPDKSEYAITCETSNEVRFFNADNDSLIAVVPTGGHTQEVEFSKSTDYVFVSCTDDETTFPGTIGSVYVLNYKTHTFVKAIYTGYQPHGIEPDDDKGVVYVANRNASSSGPAPHHTTECGGRNGYLTIIDMETLELIPDYRAELSVDPYYISILD